MKTNYFFPAVVSIVVMFLFCQAACKRNPCLPPGEKPSCCDHVRPDTTLMAHKEYLFDYSKVEGVVDWSKEGATRCPCDTTLVQFDTIKWGNPEEDPTTSKAVTKGEGVPLWNMPDLDMLDNRFFNNQGSTPGSQDNPPDKAYVKVAILDSGLDSAFLADHRHEIAEKMNMFSFTDNVLDSIGHGTAVFAVIDGHAKNRAKYYIYKCIDGNGYATTFSIACALKCAKANGVDVINLSLGGYKDNKLLADVVDKELAQTAIVGSQGNDCTLAEKHKHYPSNYKGVFSMSGINANYVWDPDAVKEIPSMYDCSNGTMRHTNYSAPSIITASDGSTSQGTSFAAAFVTGRFVVYYYDHRERDSREAFRRGFLTDRDYVRHDSLFLWAADECVDITVIK